MQSRGGEQKKVLNCVIFKGKGEKYMETQKPHSRVYTMHSPFLKLRLGSPSRFSFAPHDCFAHAYTSGKQGLIIRRRGNESREKRAFPLCTHTSRCAMWSGNYRWWEKKFSTLFPSRPVAQIIIKFVISLRGGFGEGLAPSVAARPGSRKLLRFIYVF